MMLRVEQAGGEWLPNLADFRSEFWRDQRAKGLHESAPRCGIDDTARLLGRRRTHLLIALGDGRPVGYLLGQTAVLPGPPARRVSLVKELWSLPAARRAGVARRLFEAAFARFRSDEADRIVLHALVGNVEAHAFWQRLGFSAYLTTFELDITHGQADD